jgi:hypothetical protein
VGIGGLATLRIEIKMLKVIKSPLLYFYLRGGIAIKIASTLLRHCLQAIGRPRLTSLTVPLSLAFTGLMGRVYLQPMSSAHTFKKTRHTKSTLTCTGMFVWQKKHMSDLKFQTKK